MWAAHSSPLNLQPITSSQWMSALTPDAVDKIKPRTFQSSPNINISSLFSPLENKTTYNFSPPHIIFLHFCSKPKSTVSVMPEYNSGNAVYLRPRKRSHFERYFQDYSLVTLLIQTDVMCWQTKILKISDL